MCIILLLCTFISFVYSKECYWSSKNAYSYFGAKTTYDDVRGDIRDSPSLQGCEATGVWTIMRHGTRNPGHDDTVYMKLAQGLKSAILKNYEEGRTKMCAQDIENLRKWSWNSTIEDTTNYLTPEGHEELYQAGVRFLQKYPALMESLEDYYFRPTKEQRTINSLDAFIEGLNSQGLNLTAEPPKDRDDVLRPYKHCKKHSAKILHGHKINHELHKYYDTEEFKQLQGDIQQRLGLDSPLTYKNVSGLYNLCRYHRAYQKTKRSPWCAVFTNEELEVMEYVEDISHYYRNSYGGKPINTKLGAQPLADLFNYMDRLREEKIKGFEGYFSHDSMLEMMYSALGLFRDYPEITGLERIKERKWRTSFITPFAASFAVVLHRCTDSEELQLQLFINEMEIHLCGNRTCSWSEFEQIFKPFTEVDLDFC